MRAHSVKPSNNWLNVFSFLIAFSGMFFLGASAAHAATYYYNDAAVDEDWGNLSNWWTNAGFTVPALALPGTSDDVFIYANVDTNSGSPASVRSADLSLTAVWGSLPITVTGLATFNGQSVMRGTLTGNALFKDQSFNSGTLSQNATFDDQSGNGGTVTGNAAFNDFAYNTGTVSGTKTINTPSSIDITTPPSYSVAVDSRIYEIGNLVKVINSKTDALLTTINIGGVFASVVGKKIYVSGSGVHVIDADPLSGSYNTVTASISVGSGSDNSAVVGSNVYVHNGGDNSLSVIDANPTSGTYNTVIDTISLGGPPPVAFPSYLFVIGTDIYVNNYFDDKIQVVDANPLSGTFDTVTTELPIDSSPVYTTRVSNNLYISSNGLTEKVLDIDPTSPTYRTIIAELSIGSGPLYSSANNKHVYVSNYYSSTVSVIDADSTSGTFNTVIKTIPASSSGTLYYSAPIGNKVYALDTNTLLTIDADPLSATRDTVIATTSVGISPSHFVNIGNKIYVANLNSNNITVVDADTDSNFNTYAPHLLTFTSSSTDGAYAAPQTIDMRANFDKALASGSTMTVVLNTGRSVTLDQISGATLFGTYIVQSGDATPDLTVSSISSASVSDTASPAHTQTSFHVPSSPELAGEPSGNLGDTSTISVSTAYLKIPTGTNPYQLAPSNNALYVANQGSDTVSVVSTSTNAVTATINVGSQPYGVTFATSTKEIYVTNLMGNTVSVIDANPLSGTYNTVTHTISVGDQPYYVTSLGSKIFVTNHVSNTVSVINTGSHTVTATINVGSAPLALKTVGSKLYVANFGSTYGGEKAQGTVSVIDTSSNTVTATIDVGSGARGVAVVGTEVYVTNFNDGTASVINSGNNTVTNTITVGNQPRGALGLGSKVYIENYSDGTISVINTGSHTVAATVKTGNTPAGLTGVGTNIYLSRFTDNAVSILDTTNNSLLLGSTTSSFSTPTASSVTTTGATLNGSITFDGNASSTDEGFQYGTSISYGTTASTTGTFGVGAFTQALTGLTCGTLYHFRSFATNSVGTGSSTDATFTTSSCPSSGTSNSSGNGPAAGSSSSSGNGFVPASVLAQLLNLFVPYVPGCPAGYTCTKAASSDAGADDTDSDSNTVVTAYSFAKNLIPYSTSLDVRKLQDILRVLHFFDHSSTGYYGPLTIQAVKAYQKAHQIPQTGTVGPLTRAALGK